MEHPARLTVGVVGAGRVGAVLGAALARAGHRVTGAYAVSDASLARAAALLPGVPVEDVATVVAGAELVILAVPDDALADLVAGLSATGGWQAGQIVVHTSGRSGTAVLDPVRAHHAMPLALHPAMTFTGTAMDLDRLADCTFGVTADEALRAVAEALVLEMGGSPVWVEEEDRLAYHAALAHGANHLVTLTVEAMDVLTRAGVEDPRAVLAPLLHAAVDNALRMGDAALTGPVARGDVGTVRAHLRELDRLAPDIRRTYVALARATALRALDDGRLRPAVAEPLLDILSDQER
ncbi:Rossmann-like and DUF2520 domain-containing protein [uncultured Phycicoccus sp.]|uniref:Rossmann-like and DUF2520 domain-containing protein n=1 Tax=uncultured Phycicoccus sp. TaxID=661422 RepID=UPI00260B5B01|nr:DUF2520 domain-containing protein [uncultured Phycicoccus sp.]